MNANDGSVIVATGTAPGRGDRILVRCSGDGVLAHVDDLLSGRGLDAARRGERGCFTGTLSIPVSYLTGVDGDSTPGHPAPSLPCIVAVLPGPGTFTGEDVLELEIPGNPALAAIVNRVLIAHFDRRTGHARAAGPGEFSARAFLTGRLTIRDATGIAASIAAARDEELDAADRQRRGPVAAELRAIGDRLAGAIARTEAGIDFSDEEDVVGCSVGELRSLLAEIRRGLDHTEQWLRSSRPAVRDEPLVALAGPPNAGKSTLFNALTGGDPRRIHIRRRPKREPEPPSRRRTWWSGAFPTIWRPTSDRPRRRWIDCLNCERRPTFRGQRRRPEPSRTPNINDSIGSTSRCPGKAGQATMRKA